MYYKRLGLQFLYIGLQQILVYHAALVVKNIKALFQFSGQKRVQRYNSKIIVVYVMRCISVGAGR